MEIIIDWKKIKTEDDFYNCFLPPVKAQSWHGRNLDALNDSLVTGDINEIEPPYFIKNINSNSSNESILEFQSKVFLIFSDAAIVNIKRSNERRKL